MTLNQYIYDLKMILRNNVITNTDLLSDSLIEFWIVAQRAMWIKRRDKLYIQSDHSISQTLITEIISIDRSFIPEHTSVDYKILRSEERLPKFIDFESWDGIISAGPIDMSSQRFNHCEYEEAIRSGNGRFDRSQIYSFTNDGYLYIVSKSHLHSYQFITKAAVTAIFEDPRELGNFKHITGEACWSEDDQYPINLELWNFIKAEIINLNVNLLIKVPVDLSNDDNPQKLYQP